MKRVIHKDWRPEDWNEAFYVFSRLLAGKKVNWEKLSKVPEATIVGKKEANGIPKRG